MPGMIVPIGLCILFAIHWWFDRKDFLTNQAHEKVFESQEKSGE